MADTMEALVVRIDHFHDRTLYVSTVKTWLNELSVSHGRLVTMGEFHLLFIEATPAQNDALLTNFATKNVDTTAKDEPCIDRFIDVVGRKPISVATCKGFLEMNVLNTTLLERLMVSEWHCEKSWLEDAMSTPRTKALIKWKEDAKNSRKERRKQAAKDRDVERAAKKAKAEEEKARKERETEKEEDDDDENAGEETENKESVGDKSDEAEEEKTPTTEPAAPSEPVETVQRPSVLVQPKPKINQNKRKTPPNGPSPQHQKKQHHAGANQAGSIANKSKQPQHQKPQHHDQSGKQKPQHAAKKHKQR